MTDEDFLRQFETCTLPFDKLAGTPHASGREIEVCKA